MKVILKNNVVIAKSEDCTFVENGILMDGVIYGEKWLEVLGTDLNPRIQQDMIINGEIVENPNYIPPEYDV